MPVRHRRIALALLGFLALAGCQKDAAKKDVPPPETVVAKTPVKEQPQNTDVPEPKPSEEELCVRAWLEGHRLDPYGNESGMMYAGGSPLFDETTGKSTPLLDYVYAKHPQAKAVCHPDAG